MRSGTVPVVLMLVGLAVILAVSLPELFGLIVGLQQQSTGVSGPLSDLSASIPIVLMVLVGLLFTAIAVARRR